MARVELIPEADLTPGVRCYIGQTADGVVRGLGGHRPELAERWLALYLPLCREDGALPIELKELVRFQIAGYYGCDHCRGFIAPLAAERGVMRWAPRPEQIAPEAREEYAASQQQAGQRRGGTGEGGGGAGGGGGGAAGATPGPAQAGGGPTTREARGPRGGGAGGGGGGSGPRTTRGTLWIQDGAYVRPVNVRVGLTDGTNTEVQGEGLQEGANVVVGENRPEDAVAGPGGAAPVTNPFAPQFPRGGGGGGGRRGG